MASSSPSAPSCTPSVIPPGRRRQRSVRVTVAVALLARRHRRSSCSPCRPSPRLAQRRLRARARLRLGRRPHRLHRARPEPPEAAADRAAQAQAYRSLFSERAAEHAEFTTAMTDRLAAATARSPSWRTAVVAARAAGDRGRGPGAARGPPRQRGPGRVVELTSGSRSWRSARPSEADELATWEGCETASTWMAWRTQSPTCSPGRTQADRRRSSGSQQRPDAAGDRCGRSPHRADPGAYARALVRDNAG